MKCIIEMAIADMFGVKGTVRFPAEISGDLEKTLQNYALTEVHTWSGMNIYKEG